jgi:hypothetical protein
MKNRSNMWTTKAAAVVALVGGLGGVAGATVLSAGGFPGDNFNTGLASCQVSNTGTRDVEVRSASLFDVSGTAVGNPINGAIVHPGQTREVVSASAGVFGIPAACSFDVSTRIGVRAAFVYTSGFNASTVVVIPAEK